MTRIRRSFTDELKREEVKLCKQPRATVMHIARDLGIDAGVLTRWVIQERGGVLDLRANRSLRSEAATDVERLQRELRRVTSERPILNLCMVEFVLAHLAFWLLLVGKTLNHAMRLQITGDVVEHSGFGLAPDGIQAKSPLSG